MPATPDTWRDEFVVNAGNTAGAQFEPDIVQLANGNFLVAWTDAANNVDSAPGADIIGQIFDPLGNAVGGPIHLNAAGRFFDDEGEFELAALPNGGFVMAYEDTDAGGTSIITEEYNAAGVSTAVRVITDDPGADDLGDPSVSVNANGTYIVSYQQAGAGGTSTYGKLVNPAAGTVGVQQTYVSGADDMALIQNVSMARLGNGNHVVVSQYDNDPDGAIAYRLIDPSGAGIGATRYVAGTDANDGGDSDADVAALTGGGFVVVWTNTDVFDTDILFQRYDNAGTAQGGPVTVDGGAITDENNEASITALSDGGFVIVWDDDEANVIAGQRYSASGVALGSVFTVGGAGSAPQGTSLADGRFAVTWSQGGDIRMEIFDTRNNLSPIDAPYGWHVGTVFGDVITPDVDSAVVHGWDGNDIINGSGAAKEYYGGEGDDLIYALHATIDTDLYDGGGGIDTIDWVGSPAVAGATFNLQTGVASAGGSTEAMTGFENLRGTDNDDTIIGSTANNILNGNDGDDILIGAAGADTLIGGEGSDTAYYSTSNDRVVANLSIGAGFGGHAQGDTLDTIENLVGSIYGDTLVGDAGANLLNGYQGPDILIGAAGADTLIGGSGFDTANYASSNAAVNVNLSTGLGFGGHAEGDTLNTIEALVGSIYGDLLTGDDGNNTLNGYQGNDTLRGGLGADTLIGGSGIDTANYALSNAAVNVSLLTGTGAGGHAQGDTLSSIENIVGSIYNDTLTGSGGANVLNGYQGNDILIGGAGADDLIGGSGIDTANYASSTARVRVYLDTNTALDGHAAGDTFSSIESVVGSIYGDIIFGTNGANTLNGYQGNDILQGLGGADTLIGGSGIDTAYYADSNAGVTVNLQTGLGSGGHAAGDTYSSIENITGSAHADILIGNAGNNVLRGLGGADIFVFAPSGGSDTVLDFGDDIDTLDFSAFGFASVAQALTFATDTGSDVEFNFASGATLLLAGFASVNALQDDITIA